MAHSIAVPSSLAGKHNYNGFSYELLGRGACWSSLLWSSGSRVLRLVSPSRIFSTGCTLMWWGKWLGLLTGPLLKLCIYGVVVRYGQIQQLGLLHYLLGGSAQNGCLLFQNDKWRWIKRIWSFSVLHDELWNKFLKDQWIYTYVLRKHECTKEAPH